MKILSLDDHPLFSSGLKEALSSYCNSFEITTTLRAKDAFDYLHKNRDTDLIILDLVMPEMDGLSFIRALSARKIVTPVVVMSAKEDLVELHEAFRLGALGFLPKTWSAQKLSEALIEIKNGSIVIPEHIERGLKRISKNATEYSQSLLGERQLEILELVRKGLSNKGIAAVLYISEATVKSHLQTTFKMLGAKSRIDCVCKAEQLRILPPK